HEAHGAMQPGMRMVIDDASMLEDTATKAYGWSVSLDGLRAAAEGHRDLVSFTDILQIWIEKIRSFQDLRYIVKADLEAKEAKALRERIPLLRSTETPILLDRILEHVDCILNPENLQGRITWIEQRQNGSQFLESVPERVGAMLQTSLYKTYATTLLLPASPEEEFREILPPGTTAVRAPTLHEKKVLPMTFPESVSLETIMKNPPPGKTVVLVGSRKTIEDAFVRHTEALEEKGVTLICQSLSGGQERMQAEFTAAVAPTLWLLTPWTYEGVELSPGTVDNLIIFSLPFDHPNHAVLSRRALHYRDAFGEYSLPRLKARMFRILRTFARHATENAEVQVCDDRLRTKKYGKEVRSYLEQYAESTDNEMLAEQMKLL
ncbi:MAG: ATP-dependent DNA helicase DinG, partial [Candidatus Peregrinibacteria bacterium Greene0416_62]